MGEDWKGGDGWLKEGGDDGESRWGECVVKVGKRRVVDGETASGRHGMRLREEDACDEEQQGEHKERRGGM